MGAVDNIINNMLVDKIKKLEQLLDSDIFQYYGPLDDGLVQPFIAIMDSLTECDNKRNKLSIILTTMGGSAYAVERMVRVIRHHYDNVAFYVPESAYSAGTIFCMSGDSIHMTYGSSLGPIDPQVKNKDGRYVPALGYLDKINELIDKAQANQLSEAEFLILKDIDLAEIRTYEQAKDYTVEILKKWLAKYKFRTWIEHKSSGKAVTQKEKVERAEEIARQLGDNNLWLSHARPIGIEQLRELKLIIADYGEDKAIKSALGEFYQLSLDYIIKNGARICMQTRTGGVLS